jgi:hypothetical protein
VSWTSADVITLRTAIASGVLTVHYAGPPARTITHHSLSEMRSLLAEMIADVETTAGTRRTYRLASTSKGFDS